MGLVDFNEANELFAECFQTEAYLLMLILDIADKQALLRERWNQIRKVKFIRKHFPNRTYVVIDVLFRLSIKA